MTSINSNGSIVPSPSDQVGGVERVDPTHPQDEGQEHFAELMEKKEDHDKTQQQAELAGDDPEISPEELHKRIMSDVIKKGIEDHQKKLDEMKKNNSW